MAEKKGDSSQASSSFDNRRFISCEAEKRFTKFKEDEKAIMRERALKPDPGDGKILEFIRAQNWETLATNPTLVVISLVREFYANALVSIENDRVLVRGNRISFSLQAINSHYGLLLIRCI